MLLYFCRQSSRLIVCTQMCKLRTKFFIVCFFYSEVDKCINNNSRPIVSTLLLAKESGISASMTLLIWIGRSDGSHNISDSSVRRFAHAWMVTTGFTVTGKWVAGGVEKIWQSFYRTRWSDEAGDLKKERGNEWQWPRKIDVSLLYWKQKSEYSNEVAYTVVSTHTHTHTHAHTPMHTHAHKHKHIYIDR